MALLNLTGEYGRSQVNLEGTPETLRQFVESLKSANSVHEYIFYIPDQATVWDGYLTSMRIALCDSPMLEIKRQGTELNITGDRNGLDNLATVTTFLVNDCERKGWNEHLHIEYPAWQEISTDSDALIICCNL